MKLLLLEHRTALEISGLGGKKAWRIHVEQKAFVYLDDDSPEIIYKIAISSTVNLS